MTSPITASTWRAHWTDKTLAGKKIVLAGRVSNHEKTPIVDFIEREGGVVAEEVAADTSVVLILAAGANPPPAAKKAEQLNKKQNTVIEILSLDEFKARVAPSRDETLTMFRSGGEAFDRWSALRSFAGGSINLDDSDLRGTALVGAQLENVSLVGADLRETDLSRADLLDATSAQLDGARLNGAVVVNLQNCTLVGALGEGITLTDSGGAGRRFDSDFSRAKFRNGLFREANLAGAKFSSADLSESSAVQSRFPAVDFSKGKLHRWAARDCVFDDAAFVGADLSCSDLSDNSFKNADFRNADLRNTNLMGADLSGARFDGADLTGANLSLAKVEPNSLVNAKGAVVAEPPTYTPGAKFQELDALAVKLQYYGLDFVVETFMGPCHVRISYHKGGYRNAPPANISVKATAPTQRMGHLLVSSGPSFAAALPRFLAFLGPNPKLQVDSVLPDSTRAGDVPRAAICEVFGETPLSLEELTARAAAREAEVKQARAAFKKQILAELMSGPEGIATLNARPIEAWDQIVDLKKANLSKAKLDGLKLPEYLDMTGAKFDGASLVNVAFSAVVLRKTTFRQATIEGGRLQTLPEASFENATLTNVDLSEASLTKARFAGAKLTRCNLSRAELQGADLSQATLIDCRLDHARYDAQTLFPAGFSDFDQLQWRGSGLPPHELAAEREKAAAAIAQSQQAGAAGAAADDPARRTLRREEFMAKVKQNVDKAKIDKALKMLKAERFELFIDVKEDHLVGVVKSQSDPDLVYACRLASDGSYQCCTQNLNVCGGLRGTPCKHLLVLAVGLERSDAMPPETLGLWIASSRNRQTPLDKEKMGEVLLRYKGAQVGEVDWRPTETTPEDFYAF